MVQDHQALHKCTNNNAKKSKGKKVPQRGLGVAQLERLRLEEQKRLHNATSLPSPSSSSNIFSPSLHFLHSHTSPFVSSVSSSELRFHSLSTNWKNQELNGTSVTSMNNSGSGYLPLIEPPSNQIFSSDSSSSLVSFGDDKEIVGTKRPPFNFDTIANQFPCKFAHSSNSSKPNVISSYGNDYIGFDFGPKTYSGRTSNYRNLKEDGKTCDGGFLTLGITTSLPSPSKHSHAVSVPTVQGDNDECGWNLTHSKTLYSFLPETESRCDKPQQEWTPPVHNALDLNLKL